MIEQDTIRLLRECDAGVKMGVSSIDDSMEHVQGEELRALLGRSRGRHSAIGDELAGLLDKYGDDGKEPPLMAKLMGRLKSDFKLAAEHSDEAVADSITDGCNMGIKSLSKYLNQYAAADEKSKDIAKRLITVEERLAVELRDYL